MGPADVPQPDLLPECGGQSRMEGIYASGAPELIVEVSGSSRSSDLGIKLDLNRTAGVREYVSVLLQPRHVIWCQLARGRRYREIKPGDDGLLRSRIFRAFGSTPRPCGIRSAPCVPQSTRACAILSMPLSSGAWRLSAGSGERASYDSLGVGGPRVARPVA